jgi:hypothetical protein
MGLLESSLDLKRASLSTRGYQASVHQAAGARRRERDDQAKPYLVQE